VSFATHTSNDNTCPNNLPFATVNSKNYCCPGPLVVFNAGNFNSETDFDSRAVCCVGAEDGTDAVDTVSFCPGFPFCSGTGTPVAAITIHAPSCVTKIPVTASDYTSLVVAAASSLSGSGGPTEVVTASARASASATTAGGEGTTSSRRTSTSTVTAQSSPSSGLGAPAVTARAWLKGCAGAGAAMAVMGIL
jgi:hypothetical protein